MAAPSRHGRPGPEPVTPIHRRIRQGPARQLAELSPGAVNQRRSIFQQQAQRNRQDRRQSHQLMNNTRRHRTGHSPSIHSGLPPSRYPVSHMSGSHPSFYAGSPVYATYTLGSDSGYAPYTTPFPYVLGQSSIPYPVGSPLFNHPHQTYLTHHFATPGLATHVPSFLAALAGQFAAPGVPTQAHGFLAAPAGQLGTPAPHRFTVDAVNPFATPAPRRFAADPANSFAIPAPRVSSLAANLADPFSGPAHRIRAPIVAAAPADQSSGPAHRTRGYQAQQTLISRVANQSSGSAPRTRVPSVAAAPADQSSGPAHRARSYQIQQTLISHTADLSSGSAPRTRVHSVAAAPADQSSGPVLRTRVPGIAADPANQSSGPAPHTRIQQARQTPVNHTADQSSGSASRTHSPFSETAPVGQFSSPTHTRGLDLPHSAQPHLFGDNGDDDRDEDFVPPSNLIHSDEGLQFSPTSDLIDSDEELQFSLAHSEYGTSRVDEFVQSFEEPVHHYASNRRRFRSHFRLLQQHGRPIDSNDAGVHPDGTASEDIVSSSGETDTDTGTGFGSKGDDGDDGDSSTGDAHNGGGSLSPDNGPDEEHNSDWNDLNEEDDPDQDDRHGDFDDENNPPVDSLGYGGVSAQFPDGLPDCRYGVETTAECFFQECAHRRPKIEAWFRRVKSHDNCITGIAFGRSDQDPAVILQVAVALRAKKRSAATLGASNLRCKRHFSTRTGISIPRVTLCDDIDKARLMHPGVPIAYKLTQSHICLFRLCIRPDHSVLELMSGPMPGELLQDASGEAVGDVVGTSDDDSVVPPSQRILYGNRSRDTCFTEARKLLASGEPIPRACSRHKIPCLLQEAMEPVTSKVLKEILFFYGVRHEDLRLGKQLRNGKRRSTEPIVRPLTADDLLIWSWVNGYPVKTRVGPSNELPPFGNVVVKRWKDIPKMDYAHVVEAPLTLEEKHNTVRTGSRSIGSIANPDPGSRNAPASHGLGSINDPAPGPRNVPASRNVPGSHRLGSTTDPAQGSHDAPGHRGIGNITDPAQGSHDAPGHRGIGNITDPAKASHNATSHRGIGIITNPAPGQIGSRRTDHVVITEPRNWDIRTWRCPLCHSKVYLSLSVGDRIPHRPLASNRLTSFFGAIRHMAALHDEWDRDEKLVILGKELSMRGPFEQLANDLSHTELFSIAEARERVSEIREGCEGIDPRVIMSEAEIRSLIKYASLKDGLRGNLDILVAFFDTTLSWPYFRGIR